MRTRHHCFLVATMVAVGLHGRVPAQIADGHYVVSSLQQANTFGGLFVVHPRTAGPASPITGLGVALTGSAAAWGGSNCVSYRPDDGQLLVGEITLAGNPVYLHEITVNGTAVVSDVATVVGTAASAVFGGAINQIAMLPNGDAVFCVSGLTNQPPLSGNTIGYFDRATKAVTSIPTPVFGTDSPNAIAFDPVLAVAYVSVSLLPSSACDIYSVPLSGGATLITTSNLVSHLAVMPNGNLLANSAQDVIEIDPQTGSTTLRGTIGSNINGMLLERATAAPVAVLNGVGPTGPGVYWLDGATPRLLATNIPGIGSGIAVIDSPRTYGTPTPGNFAYEFAVQTAPGGLPLAGSATFGIRVDAATGPGNIGFLAANLAAADVPLFGVRVLIDPNNVVPVGLFQPGTVVPFPIPAGFPSLQVFFQSFHPDAGNAQGVASTAGMLVGTIL